jgi:aromatic-L-amino-acid decarboxylase
MTEKKGISLTNEEMRRLGYRVVDMIVDHLSDLREKPVSRKVERKDLERILREPVPETGDDIDRVIECVRENVLDRVMHLDHPRFFAFVPGPGGFVGAMADALASGYNVFSSTWLEGSGATEIELVTIDWLCRIFGLPVGAGGVFVSGGSVANLTALMAARHTILGQNFSDGIAYFSDQTHSSVERALWILGFAPQQIKKLPTDDHYRIIPELLSREIEHDRAAGKRPFCVVANAGTTNTGAVDPIEELSAICRKNGMWLHVDGAYGAAAILAKKGRPLFSGLPLADSLVVDPHKWLFCPFEIGCILVRDRSLLKNAFRIMPEYLQDAERQGEEFNFCEYGIQLTRGFRALKLWMSIKVFGLAAFRDAVSAGIENAETAEKIIARSPNWEVVTPAQIGIVTFMASHTSLSFTQRDELHRILVERMVADGYAFLSSTILGGRVVLRMCTINPQTTSEDIEGTIRRLDSFLEELASF